MRDNPELADKPIAVGGSPERRGVVATCNYAARKFGIHSAMSSAIARKRCADLIIVRPDMEKYRSASSKSIAFLNAIPLSSSPCLWTKPIWT